ncbi:TPA: GTP cyclohydrolase II [Legionella pneumophila]|nr:GTP cyclohydrolase II [Legionella pneumophila]
MSPDDSKKKSKGHIVLSSHPARHTQAPLKIKWGEKNPKDRGPVIASLTNIKNRNAVGTHSGSYSVYRALAVAAGLLDPEHVPDLTDTMPPVDIGPHKQWSETGDVVVTKAAIEPVWYLPGIAERFQVSEALLRRTLFEQTAGMFPELVTRSDLDVFLPPIGGLTAYFFGDVTTIHNPEIELTCRIHDECNGSDVFGSDICTCRPYLVHGIELSIESAQKGGAGLIVYNRKEGRALGEVTKFLVYNARKRQKGGDTAAKYFERTECVAGVQDMRFQELMSDILHWLGITKIHRFVSMSNMKYDALLKSGINVIERVKIPDELIPPDARVEIDAKRAAGYYSPEGIIDINELAKSKGRALHE